MKLKGKLPEIETRYKACVKEPEFKTFLREGKENHWYVKNYETWAANMLKSALYKPSEICAWYKEYNVDNTHITNVFKAFMKGKGLI